MKRYLLLLLCTAACQQQYQSAVSGAAEAPTAERLAAFRQRAQTRHRVMLAEQQLVSQHVPAYYAVEPGNYQARNGHLRQVRVVLRNLTHYALDTAVVQLRYITAAGRVQLRDVRVGRIPAEGVAQLPAPDGTGVQVGYELLMARSRALGVTYQYEGQ